LRKGILVRIGIDQTYGNWNAPIDPKSNEFLYIPIPENERFEIRNGMRINFSSFTYELKRFCKNFGVDLKNGLKFPEELNNKHAHLDPDFRLLTYGDNGKRRGAGVAELRKGDFIVFYSSLKPISKCKHKLVYALIGILVIDKIVKAINIEANNHNINAHTRKKDISENDIVVFGQNGKSGRFDKCIPIGEWRERAYRVEKKLLDNWGGLSVKDGYIQRSAVPPEFTDFKKFVKWLGSKNINLLNYNNYEK